MVIYLSLLVSIVVFMATFAANDVCSLDINKLISMLGNLVGMVGGSLKQQTCDRGRPIAISEQTYSLWHRNHII